MMEKIHPIQAMVDGMSAAWQKERAQTQMTLGKMIAALKETVTDKQVQRLGNPRFHFHDLRAKSISDNKNLDAAYLLAGHIDIKMTRRVYDRNIRMVEPLR